MLKLHALDWFHVKGRGKVASVDTLPEEFYKDHWHPNQLKGEQVEIDGIVYTVMGAEVYLIGGIDENHPYKMPCGLLVKES